MKLLTAVALVLFATCAVADNLETYNLHQRQASELIPILQPLLPPGSAISGQGYTLIVRGNADAQNTVQQLLEKLDASLHNLRISVRFSAPTRLTSNSSGADIRVHAGDGDTTIRGRAGQVPRDSAGQITVHGKDVSVRGGISEQYQTSTDDSEYSLRVLEGNTAYIRTGTAIPYGTQTVYPGGTVQGSIELHQVDSGFYVRPRLRGDEVLLDILPQREKESASGGGRIDTQSISTTVSAPLGQWTELGGVSTSSSQQSGQTLYSTSNTRNSDNAIFVKVDIIP